MFYFSRHKDEAKIRGKTKFDTQKRGLSYLTTLHHIRAL